jgi:hypothetical protein
MKINKCENCVHITTLRSKQCYTLSRILKEQVTDKGLPFFPNIVIPILEETGRTCKRFKEVVDVAYTSIKIG